MIGPRGGFSVHQTQSATDVKYLPRSKLKRWEKIVQWSFIFLCRAFTFPLFIKLRFLALSQFYTHPPRTQALFFVRYSRSDWFDEGALPGRCLVYLSLIGLMDARVMFPGWCWVYLIFPGVCPRTPYKSVSLQKCEVTSDRHKLLDPPLGLPSWLLSRV